tara:strand:- start:294 stop:467 length:174 start_codon:yes stop_codon:yes gene_type:complete
MIIDFAVAVTEMGLRKWQIFLIAISILVFPITFFISSKNLDSKAVFGWMLKKPNEHK